VYVKPEWEHLNGSNGTTDFTMSLAQVPTMHKHLQS
jgi:hypothetical protein